MKAKIIIPITLLLITISAYSQWTPDKLTTSPFLIESDSNKITINADVVGFLKNNEYFSPIVKGETFPGIRIRPTVAYQVGTNLKAELGMTSLYYSGDQQKDGTYLFNGIFARLQYAIKPNFNLVFGNYYDGVNHRLIEPLYRWENQLINKPESGLQLIYEDQKYFADVWLNWQRFIQKGDSVPEVLTFGVSSSMRLTKSDNPLKISIPLQLVIHHQGGQIDVSEEKMIVSGNLATGICSEYSINHKLIKSIGANIYLVGYYDKLPDNSIRPYDKGWGIYPTFSIDASPFKALVGYWHAKKFYSFEGEPLFASFNTDYPDDVLTNRSMLTFKASYSQQLHKMFSVGVQAETYSDLNRGKTDYSFGVYLRFNGTLFSK